MPPNSGVAHHPRRAPIRAGQERCTLNHTSNSSPRTINHREIGAKEILQLARDVVAAEREAPEETREEKAALTELFEEVRNDKTPIIVERIVNEIDEIVRVVRFDGWQATSGGERLVKKKS